MFIGKLNILKRPPKQMGKPLKLQKSATCKIANGSLVGGLEPWNFMTFHILGIVIIPSDFHSIIFQRGRYTTKQIIINHH